MLDSDTRWPLDETAPITPQFFRMARERNIHVDPHPGDRVSDSKIARGFHSSRQPLREAFINGFIDLPEGEFPRPVNTPIQGGDDL